MDLTVAKLDLKENMDPFQLFPEEIWEMILDIVDDSNTAWNLFKAFPQLDNNSRLQKKKHLWLFGLVIPQLIPWKFTRWINQQDLLNCRQVSKKWSTFVDNFLENQPQLKAYHPDKQSESFYWNTRAYHEKNDIGRYDNREANHLGGARLDNFNFPWVVPGRPPSEFLEDMGAHPPGRNPFVSRSLSVILPYQYGEQGEVGEEGEVEDRDKTQKFFDDTMSLYRKFGKHIWYYEIYIPVRKDERDLQYIPECFRLLPNLRRLSVDAYDGFPKPSEEDVDKLMEAMAAKYPPLPHLESLKIQSPFPKVGHLLVNRFSTQIRRLEIQLTLWKDEFCQMFPNLAELQVRVHNPEHAANLRKLILNLEAPQLVKLQVVFMIENGGGNRYEPWSGLCPFVMEDDIFQWLKRYPNLRYLDFGDECPLARLEEKGTLSPETDSAPSLQFLSIRSTMDLNYNFLHCLPSLQHLQIYVYPEPHVHDNSVPPGEVRIREEIQHANIYMSNIWEILPKLRTVTLLKDDNVNGDLLLQQKWDFNREEYEFERERGFPRGEFAALRWDVFTYLDINARYSYGQ